MKTALHIHTENSLKECGLKIDDVLKKLKEMGFEKAVLGDACNMTGAVEFCNKAGKYGITPVLGVECLLQEQDGKSKILLVAKGKEGYVSLCRLVTDANANLSNTGKPMLTVDQLKGHAGLIVCCGGIESYIAYPYRINNQYKKLSESTPQAETQETKEENQHERLEEIQAALKEKREERKRIQSEIKKRNAALAISGGTLKDDCLEKELERIKKEINRFSRIEKTVKKQISDVQKKAEKIKEKEEAAKQIRAQIISQEEVLEKMKERLGNLKRIFGKDLAVEITSHGEKEEREINNMLLRCAEELSVVPVLSEDSYTLDGTKEEVLKWHLVQSLQENAWVPTRPTSENYGIEQEDGLLKRMDGSIPKERFASLAENTDLVFQSCSMTFDKKEHYPKYPVPEGKTATCLMEQRARAAIPKLYGKDGWTADREEKLKEEIAVIDKTGYSDYTLTIADILNDARAMAAPEVISCLVGPGRGSGAGSLVNYLMGITSLDPVEYGLIFERYLNIERVSPPDIDSDIATSIRDALVSKIKEKYKKKEGSIGVCGILTKNRLTAKAAIRAAGRILSHKQYGNTTALYSLSDRMSKSLPSDPKLKLSGHTNELKESFTSKDAAKILHYALLLEGTVQAYGTHAAGVIISDSGDITDYAPLINIGTKETPVWNIQYDMVESESIGLLKMDMLGLSTLDICYTALRLIYARHGKKIDLYHIPFEKEVFREIYSKGATDGVFQCESAGMKRMWMDLKPTNIEDIIAGIALYRPGPMDFIPAYIKGKENPSSIQYKTEKLRPILESTYGCIVFQEQVMRIVRDLAGYSMGRSDLVRRAMSKKKEDVMAQERQNFVYGNPEEGIPGCAGNGIAPEIANSIYDDMVDFAKYAFNKSHAAAYALVSYQTAWLKYHYPEEFMTAAMDVAARQNAPEKLPGLLHECRRLGIEVLPPDVNRSKEGFSIVDGKILYGLWAVKSVKENAPEVVLARKPIYHSFKEFLLTCKANKTTVTSLIKAGAFKALQPSRTGLLESLNDLLPMRKKIWAQQEKEKETQNAMEKEEPGTKKYELACLKHRNAQRALHALMEEYEAYTIPFKPDPVKEKLDYEKETLFAYLTAHPLDAYDEDPECVCMGNIGASDIGTKGAAVMGCILGFKEVKRKKDGRPMAVFTLQDKTGEQKCICYSGKYREYQEVLKEGHVIYAFCNINGDIEDAEKPILSINFARLLTPNLNPVLFSTTKDGIPNALEAVTPYLEEQGHPLFWHIKDGDHPGQLIVTGKYVSQDITNQFDPSTVIEAEYARKRRR